MSVALRAARPGDLDRLVAIEEGSFASDRISRRSLARLIGAPSAACRVVTVDGTVAGYHLVLFRKNARRARLYSLAVDPAWRGRGLAQRLLADAERTARRRGSTTLGLEVRTDNVAAIGLYERAGYRETGRYTDYYADGADARRFEKTLGGG